jgi:flagellar hook-length control protein FliK
VAASAPAAAQPAVPADALAAAAPAAAGAGAAQPPAAAAATPQAATHTASHAAASLQPQLAKPLFTLVGAPHGQHVMTLKVSPEDLGPLTVRAHIDAGGVRIELFAPGEVGREAVRGILPELRKELADAGFGASLDLSDHSGPGNPGQNSAGQNSDGQDRPGAGPSGTGLSGAGRDAAGNGPGGRNGAGEPRPGPRWDPRPDEAAGNAGRILTSPQTTLDILV